MAEKLLYPPGEEDFDWAEARAILEEGWKVEDEALRNDKIGPSDLERSSRNHQDCQEKQPDIEGEFLQNDDDRNDHHDRGEDSGEDSEVDGELRPLVDEGLRVMVCIDYELRQTRFALKDYLLWIDEDTGHLFHQFFHHYDKYPVGSKAVRNYITAMDERPKRVDRMNLRSLIGLRAEVYVETVKPEFSVGVLKGQPMPENHYYSKVAEIIRPLERVDTNTLNQLRKRC